MTSTNIKALERHLSKLMSEHKFYETLTTIWEHDIPEKDKPKVIGHWLSAAQDCVCPEDFITEGLPFETQLCANEDGKLQLIIALVYCGHFDTLKAFFHRHRYSIPSKKFAQGQMYSALLLDASEIEAAGYLSFFDTISNEETEVFFYWLTYIFANKDNMTLQDSVELLSHKFPRMNVQYVLLQLSRIYLKDLAPEAFLKINTPDDLMVTPLYQQITDNKFTYEKNLENSTSFYDSISKPILKQKVSEMMALTEEVIACPQITGHLQKLKSVADANNIENICQILSTGRAGTYSISLLLNEKTESHFGWHSLQYSFHPIYRRKLMAYMLTDIDMPKEELKQYILSYLYARTAELVSSYNAKRIPVIVNHWDVIFSPILAKLFPNMKFLSISRNIQSYFYSAYSKQQWGNFQSEPLLFDSKEFASTGLLKYKLDKSKSYEYKIAWFSAFSDKLGVVMQELMPDRVTTLKAENIFKREEKTISQLRESLNLTLDNLSDEDLEAHYSEVINEKSEKARYSKEEIADKIQTCQTIYDELYSL